MEDDQNDDLQIAKSLLAVKEWSRHRERLNQDLVEWLVRQPTDRVTFRWWRGWFS